MPEHQSLTELEGTDEFIARHIGPMPAEQDVMLEAIGAASLDALISETVPASILLDAPLDLPGAVTERAALARLREVAAENVVMTSLIGQGYSDTITPAVIQRNVLENPAWYTSYTPYQPEISQGRLEALLNYQTLVADLTGLPLANASLLDEATAAAEAMTMARRATKSDSAVFFVDNDCHPQTIAVVQARAVAIGIDVVVGAPDSDLPATLFGALLAVPGSSGVLRDVTDVVDRVHAAGGLAVVVADPLAMVVVTSPAAMGADIAVGSMQRYGVPMMFGGPHAGFMATKDEFARSLPGRLVGVSLDAAGRPALRLALQTREQHIRREKATSNVCTAQALLAIIAAMYASWHGAEGLRRIALRTNRLTSILVAGLREGGIEVPADTWFDTVVVSVPGRAEAIHEATRAEGINLRQVDADHVGISLDETTTRDVVEAVWRAFGVTASVEALDASAPEGIPAALRREDAILNHPVFQQYREEHDMMRYLRRLADKDLALDRTMIPLGSCTMKLNAATEMVPVTWPEFAGIHPFAPADQTPWLHPNGWRPRDARCARSPATTPSRCSPTPGRRASYAGLLAIRAYHLANGDTGRSVCLIPSVGAWHQRRQRGDGWHVEWRWWPATPTATSTSTTCAPRPMPRCDALAAIMITYPSTHGVFEEAVGEICAIVHDARRPGVRGWRQPQRPGGAGQAGQVRRATSRTSTCTRPSASRTAAVAREWAPWPWVRTWRRYLPNHPLRSDAGPATGVGRHLGRALGIGGHPAHPVGCTSP